MGITTAALWCLEISQSILAISPLFWCLMKKLIQTHACVRRCSGDVCPLATHHAHMQKTTKCKARKPCLNTQWLHPLSSSTSRASLLLKKSDYHKHSPTAEKSAALFNPFLNLQWLRIQVSQGEFAHMKFFSSWKNLSHSWHFCCSWYKESRS